MKRSQPALHLSKSPLALVLCQLRFMRIRAMEETYIARLQDAFRLDGYPRDLSREVHELVLTPSGPKASVAKYWEFTDKARLWSIRITEGFLAIQTTNYQTFEEFLERLERACQLLAGVIDGVDVERLGLRYVDVIRPGEGETYRDYVQAGLHGLEEDSPMLNESLIARHEIRGQTGFGEMIVRLSQQRNGQVLPEDIDTQLTVPEQLRDVKPDELITLLDLDHFRVEQVEYDDQLIARWAWELHDDLDAVFRKTVTESALETWK